MTGPSAIVVNPIEAPTVLPKAQAVWDRSRLSEHSEIMAALGLGCVETPELEISRGKHSIKTQYSEGRWPIDASDNRAREIVLRMPGNFLFSHSQGHKRPSTSGSPMTAFAGEADGGTDGSALSWRI